MLVHTYCMGNSHKRRELRSQREQAGLCVYCGLIPPTEDRKGCSECLRKQSEINSRYSKRHPDRIREKRRECRWKVIEKYGGRCCCCGEDTKEFLTIDHKNNDGCVERMELYGTQSGSGYRWFLKLIRDSVRDDLQVLCYNCNNARHVFGVCPHEQREENS